MVERLVKSSGVYLINRMKHTDSIRPLLSGAQVVVNYERSKKMSKIKCQKKFIRKLINLAIRNEITIRLYLRSSCQ